MTKPFFIAIEGLDGSGKSAHTKFLCDYLTAHGISAMVTHEPTYESTASKKIKEVLVGKQTLDPLSMQKLYIEDRIWHLERTIEPALADNISVICDRYWLSTVAYGSLNDLEETLIELHEDMRKPDITVIFDTEPEECLARINKRGETPEFFDKLEKMKRIQSAYRSLAVTVPDTYIIDNNQPLEDAHQEAITLLKQARIIA